MSDRHLLEVKNLHVDFRSGRGSVPVLKGVTWHLEHGETLAILGESGSGKSLTAAAVMGLIDTPPGRISAGEILFEGNDLLRASPAERRQVNGRRIAMIFQDPLASLNPVLCVGDQIAEAFTLHGTERALARTRAVDLLHKVGIDDAERRARDYPHQFSGGQRQRVMIAMAMALRPALLIADEPTSALDVTVQAQILDLIRELHSETGMALLLITHDLGVVEEMADRVAVMKDGAIVECGPVAEVFAAPTASYTAQLLAAVPGRGPLPQERLINEHAPLLRAHNLTKQYTATRGLFGRKRDNVHALRDVSFSVNPGETVGIVGESGSGKSTLAKVLLGLENPDGGTADFLGRALFTGDAGERQQVRRQLQVVFQDPTASLNPRMTVAQIVAEPWEIHPGIVAPAEHRDRVEELLTQVGLKPEHANRRPHQFSGGQRQRIAIARALALRPKLIICDEAVSALDVSVQAQIIELLKSLQAEYGLSYLFIAHDLAVVRDFADRVLVMFKGEIVEQGTTRAVFGAPVHPYTRRLLAASPSVTPPPVVSVGTHSSTDFIQS